jgi:hypothetical protein
MHEPSAIARKQGDVMQDYRHRGKVLGHRPKSLLQAGRFNPASADLDLVEAGKAKNQHLAPPDDLAASPQAPNDGAVLLYGLLNGGGEGVHVLA